MENPMARIYRKMMKDLEKLPENWVTTFQEEIGKYIQGLLQDAFNPQAFSSFIRGMGIDMGQLGQMFSGMAQTGTMPQGFDPYRILGLDKEASDEEIKKRYRKLVHKLHPDTAGIEGTSFLLQMVLAAYELIKKERGFTSNGVSRL